MVVSVTALLRMKRPTMADWLAYLAGAILIAIGLLVRKDSYSLTPMMIVLVVIVVVLGLIRLPK
jgi:hypothetical protein